MSRHSHSLVRRTLAGLALVVSVAACSTAESVIVDDVWSRPVPPVSPASAVYMEITNGLEGPITVTGASSAACAAMQIHETSMDDAGVMSMREMAPCVSSVVR